MKCKQQPIKKQKMKKNIMPTKNKVFCKDCERTKMLFETKNKANNFIAFNQEEIETESGYAPQRSYFCLFCGGWHITSIKEVIGISKNEKLLENFLAEKKAKANADKAKDKEDKEEKLNKITSVLENQIKGMDTSQMDFFFTEQINLLKKVIEDLSNPTNPVEKKRLKELRQELQTINIVRKQNGFHKTNNYSVKLGERELEEWKLWYEKKSIT